MMQVNLDIGHAEVSNLRDAFEEGWMILLLRIKEGVLRGLAGGVSRGIAGNARPFLAPASYASQRSLNGCAHAERLVVVGDHYPGPFGAWRTKHLPGAIFQPGHKPDFCVPGKVHRICLRCIHSIRGRNLPGKCDPGFTVAGEVYNAGGGYNCW